MRGRFPAAAPENAISAQRSPIVQTIIAIASPFGGRLSEDRKEFKRCGGGSMPRLVLVKAGAAPARQLH
jgi:hypothetical protein